MAGVVNRDLECTIAWWRCEAMQNWSTSTCTVHRCGGTHIIFKYKILKKQKTVSAGEQLASANKHSSVNPSALQHIDTHMYTHTCEHTYTMCGATIYSSSPEDQPTRHIVKP
jgi:hypothetical protein